MAVIIAFLSSASAFTEPQGFFAGVDVAAGMASGSSSTKNGGAAFAGGGVVGNVTFGDTVGIGGHAGYRFDPVWSVFASYQHVRGSVSWDANFPLFGVASGFAGTAIGNGILANVAYDLVLSDRTSLRVSTGLGLTFNTLSGVVEIDKGSGQFLSDVKDHTKLSPMAQAGAGIRHKIAPNAMLGLDALVAYTGGFETGNTRSGNLGITSITPYKIDDVWRASLNGSLKVSF